MQLKAQFPLFELEQDGQSLLNSLNRLSLFDFPHLFAALELPPVESLRGVFQGFFVGPGWLRRLAGPLLAVSGLGGWWGKDFDSQGNAINLVQRKEHMQRRFPMLLSQQVSLLDGRSGLALRYAPENPLPWPWIVDELRSLKPGMLLGMSMLRTPVMKWLALPFVLEAQSFSPSPNPASRREGEV